MKSDHQAAFFAGFDEGCVRIECGSHHIRQNNDSLVEYALSSTENDDGIKTYPETFERAAQGRCQ